MTVNENIKKKRNKAMIKKISKYRREREKLVSRGSDEVIDGFNKKGY